VKSRSPLRFSALALALAACSGPPVPSPLTGEPICADFEVGATKTRLEGGLKNPVRLMITEGKSVLMKTTILGLRTPTSTPTHLILPNDDGEYTVEWAQCENERAPRPVDRDHEAKADAKITTAYECGEAKVYKTETLKTTKGNLSTHALAFPIPPKAQCWASEGSTN
jgi:hypothetical protein